jgi:hypothetical protein
MRGAGVRTLEQAHDYLLNDYLAWWERELTVEAASNGDAHRALDKSQHLAARILLIVRMSSDRLFLDRVGRHQSPSPLHRHEQSNTHISKPRPKGDISTLQRRRHFYFALTPPK